MESRFSAQPRTGATVNARTAAIATAPPAARDHVRHGLHRAGRTGSRLLKTQPHGRPARCDASGSGLGKIIKSRASARRVAAQHLELRLAFGARIHVLGQRGNPIAHSPRRRGRRATFRYRFRCASSSLLRRLQPRSALAEPLLSLVKHGELRLCPRQHGSDRSRLDPHGGGNLLITEPAMSQKQYLSLFHLQPGQRETHFGNAFFPHQPATTGRPRDHLQCQCPRPVAPRNPCACGCAACQWLFEWRRDKAMRRRCLLLHRRDRFDTASEMHPRIPLPLRHPSAAPGGPRGPYARTAP